MGGGRVYSLMKCICVALRLTIPPFHVVDYMCSCRTRSQYERNMLSLYVYLMISKFIFFIFSRNADEALSHQRVIFHRIFKLHSGPCLARGTEIDSNIAIAHCEGCATNQLLISASQLQVLSRAQARYSSLLVQELTGREMCSDLCSQLSVRRVAYSQLALQRPVHSCQTFFSTLAVIVSLFLQRACASALSSSRCRSAAAVSHSVYFLKHLCL